VANKYDRLIAVSRGPSWSLHCRVSLTLTCVV